MKIGYPCINRSIGCSGNKTFQLKSFTKERLLETVQSNLDCLEKILIFNVINHLLFFRISSDLVPFASHPIMSINWQEEFKNRFKSIGEYIKEKNIRISMHPGQYTVLNSPSSDVVQRSAAELDYHAQILELMDLTSEAKIQLHVGGVYGNKLESLQRFIRNYRQLNSRIKRYLVVENDERSYCLVDCLNISAETGAPVLFDVFHESIFTKNFMLNTALELQKETWSDSDGIPMLDYSSQKADGKMGAHSDDLVSLDFLDFINESQPYEFDLMLEIKNKEKAALEALELVKADSRFRG
ncbi:MAG: UV DNA damage repair endonuclease UvsE [Candidatus Marinimicrobia bacterium]|nr:UV DNA damage repair endonuclease UvsE [Candidatus Neomarinimicrobiota bacterium]